MRPGFSVDLETQRADGQHWDLCKDSHVEDLLKLLEEEKPTFLGGSPPCGPFSSLQTLVDAANKTPVHVRKQRMQEGKKHLRTAVQAYWQQLEAGRYFLHEHPQGARSWEEPYVQELRNDPRVYEVVGPMCRWEMQPTRAERPGEERDSMDHKFVASGQCFLWGLLQYPGEDVAHLED